MKAALVKWDTFVADDAIPLLEGRRIVRSPLDNGRGLAVYRDDLEELITDTEAELERLEEYLRHLGLVEGVWLAMASDGQERPGATAELAGLKRAYDVEVAALPFHTGHRSSRVDRIRTELSHWRGTVSDHAVAVLREEESRGIPVDDMGAELATFRCSVEGLVAEIMGELDQLNEYRRYLELLEKVWAEVDPLLSPALEDDQAEETPAGP
jgi:hypothetical protein